MISNGRPKEVIDEFKVSYRDFLSGNKDKEIIEALESGLEVCVVKDEEVVMRKRKLNLWREE